MTRREWLERAALVSVAWGMSTRETAAQPRSASSALDHLLLGAPDLDAAVAWFEKTTGVRPVIGGSHPGMGTRNALVSLGGRQYLEIIAPDPAQSTYNFHIDVRALPEPRLVTWAAATPALDNVVSAARSAGLKVFGPADGSRVRPDGTALRWRSAGIVADLRMGTVDPVPFFIEWASDSPHPAADSPGGCRLRAFEVSHPDPERLQRVLATLGVDARVTRAPAAALAAVITTRDGELRLAS
jgi:Glyoxalase-like domain